MIFLLLLNLCGIWRDVVVSGLGIWKLSLFILLMFIASLSSNGSV